MKREDAEPLTANSPRKSRNIISSCSTESNSKSNVNTDNSEKFTPPRNNCTLRAIRKSKVGFSERLKAFLSSPNYGDGLGSKLRPISRTRRKRPTTLRSANCMKPLMDINCPRSQQNKRRRTSYNVKHHLKDLADILGIDSSALSTKQVEFRKQSIHLKLQVNRLPDFTLEEEYDIHSRAECYVDKVSVDPQHYIKPDDFIDCMALGHHDVESVCLPNGVQLIKPMEKLVELVAQTIHSSPDQMLQVQQVYAALQKRFPFFQCLDKACLTSWRSSIRHALFQKWFHKLVLQCDEIAMRGCYWTINRDQRPKEWNLPPLVKEENSQEEDSKVDAWSIQCHTEAEGLPSETEDDFFVTFSSEVSDEQPKVASRNPNPMFYTPPLSQQDSEILEQVTPPTPTQLTLEPSSPMLFPDWLTSSQDVMLDKTALLAETDDMLFHW